MARIISGLYGGLHIDNPKHKIRPTTGKVKEYIFNVLQTLEGHCVIDLFCGTGALGIEALSRYADHVTFVDMNVRSIRLTRSNLERIHAPGDSWACIKQDAFRFIKKTDRMFDLILADPPYDLKLTKEFLEDCREHLNPDGRVILEYSSRGTVEFGDWKPDRVKTFGDTNIYIFCHGQ